MGERCAVTSCNAGEVLDPDSRLTTWSEKEESEDCDDEIRRWEGNHASIEYLQRHNLRNHFSPP